MDGPRLWHPFADMAAVSATGELVIDSGDGAYVTDAQGRRYLDATAGLWFCNVGHGRREIVDAVATQMGRLEAYSTFGDFANAPAIALADRLSAMAPMPDARIFFTSGGSDAVDTAVKLARRYWIEVGAPQRHVIISREKAYHGMHMAGTSLAGIEPNRAMSGGLDPNVTRVPWDDADALAVTLDELGDRAAAFFCEPVIGAGGVFAPPEGYLQAVERICRERGVLFVVDEVISGFGRTGAMFAAERWGLQPDLLLTAKGLTSGYLPMGAVFASGRIAEPFYSGAPGTMWRHGYTYSGHASCAAAALANLEILDRERLPEYVARTESVLARVLGPVAHYDMVSEVRAGVGLLGAVQLAPDAVAADTALPGRLIAALREKHVLTRMLAGNAVQISPPFVVTETDLATLVDALCAALEQVGARRSGGTAPGRVLDVDLLPERVGAGATAYRDDDYLRERPPHHN
jgi:putrescine aminotransferase